ncbi:hypothetical protein [Streptomyces noursei]|uniref:Uncharacterized protein n=1 Tax=Streptomyces noursei TaxID=1971 RepID=A0A401R5B7_STRNR|nr:hypothetical protein [Streptomyces noursei]EXU87850.1 hypothetical protein P354_33565 [Streptomyces noursei PD-1]MCZ0972833.1 hypothetical protein [Streptomyces noursei]UWS73717.1 hypothetical protein N1H47_22205 [Streptomyces noursei]GCB92783.1 hypothetical protein SALB_05558 [Streptomyces noursei]
MATEIEKAAERVAKLRAQAEKVSGPLVEAEAQLQAAEEAEAARRAERAEDYNREFVDSWRERADSVVASGDEFYDKFAEAISAEPWFQAYAEYRAARHKRGHVLTEAQRAQRALGETVTVPEPRWFAAEVVEDIAKLVEKRAYEMAAEYSQGLEDEREARLSGKG